MAKEGATILSQVEGLLEEFLDLDYDTPLKEVVSSQWLPGVKQGLEQLRSESEAPMAQSPEEQDPRSPSPAAERGDQFSNFKDARRAAVEDGVMKRGRDQGPEEEVQSEEEEVPPRKKKRTKAPSY